MHTVSSDALTDALPLNDAEIVQLQIRVIALENLLTVLLAEASENELELARDMAAYISPRPGFTPHRLTIHAAARMINLIEGAGHLRRLRFVAAEIDGSGRSPPAEDLGRQQART